MTIDAAGGPAASSPRRRARRRIRLSGATQRRLRRLLRRELDAARRSTNPLRRNAYVLARQVGRRTVNRLTGRQVGWMATLWGARWLDGTCYEITGWAYERDYGYVEAPHTRVFLSRPADARTIEARVRMVPDMEVNGMARRADHDYANTAFVAVLDLAPLLTDLVPGAWQVRVEVAGSDGTVRRGSFRTRHRLSSAGVLGARSFDDDDDGVVQFVVPRWRRRRGLFFSRREPAVVAHEVQLHERRVTMRLDLRGLAVARAEFVSTRARRPLELMFDEDGRCTATATLEPTWTLGTEVVRNDTENVSDDTATAELRDVAGADVEVDEDAETANAGRGEETTGASRVGQRIALQVYRVVVTDEDGKEYGAACTLDRTRPVHDPSSGMTAYAGPRGGLSLSDAEATLLVEDVRLEPAEHPRLRLSGHAGGDLHGVALVLVGRRQELAVDVTVMGDSWAATVDLHQGQWGGPALLPRAGSYTLRAVREVGPQVRVACTMELIRRTPEQLDLPEARLRLEIGRGRTLRLRVGLTRAADELGSFHQRRLDARYVRPDAATGPARSIYFESFYGRLATCNPYAVDAVIARDHPGWTRYWGVTDLSVAVPDGAVAVVEGTTAWFQARTTSRYVVVNDWLRRRFVPQPFQTVLQTWHGSMFKRIGLDRPAVSASTRLALITERDKWDVLLSQNHHSTQIFASSYDWTGPVYQEGYPRNDPLTAGSGAHVRERLGLRPDQKVVLYAPTWRDDVHGMVVFLDLQRLTEDLGEEYVVLLRGHSRTVGHGGSVHQRGVIDVTTYPSITELFLAADVLVTDYSSVMFDYSVTRRPMVFFVPDLDVYKDQIRGVYFDLAELAPGPVVATQEEVTGALQRVEEDRASYAQRYDAWVGRFNAHDDGRSAERVVRRLFTQYPPG